VTRTATESFAERFAWEGPSVDETSSSGHFVVSHLRANIDLTGSPNRPSGHLLVYGASRIAGRLFVNYREVSQSRCVTFREVLKCGGHAP
jgi:hypothetical protein